MSAVLALIPARSGSKGIPNKNFAPLAGAAPVCRAIRCAAAVEGIVQVVVTSDRQNSPDLKDSMRFIYDCCTGGGKVCLLDRPAELAQDDTPMIDVVKHALAAIPGPPDQIILLIQPTQPLRKPLHLTQAVDLLRSSGADSVVSVVELPLTHSPHFACFVAADADGEPYLVPWLWEHDFKHSDKLFRWQDMPRRQDARPAHIRDGTVYAFWRNTVEQYGHIYGRDVRPLIIPASETCSLDTPEDWSEVERRLRA